MLKTETGICDVAVRPHRIPMLKDHLRKNITEGKEGLFWPRPHIDAMDLRRVVGPGTGDSLCA